MAFWKPTENVDRGNEYIAPTCNRFKHLPLQQQRGQLSIARYRSNLLHAVENYRTVIVVGETGSGKSTQIPIYLHEAGWTADNRCVVCTQPRRVAATTVASRVSQELNVQLGTDVGYAIRFESKYVDSTIIKYCTDGILLRETLTDPLLSMYSVIMVDEAHERSLNSDMLLGLLKKICRKRKDLRIIITSATLNATLLKDFFEFNNSTSPSADTACILSVHGRLFPVDILYLQDKPTANYIRQTVDTVLDIHAKEDTGDILAFLPGGEEIDDACRLLQDELDARSLTDLLVHPMYSALPVGMQMAIFDPPPMGKRKVVIATNIAETSITIEGIRYVVDAGFVKLNYFNVTTGVDELVTCPVSQAAACQRAGRAGRTQSGKCFRLMTESSFQLLQPHAPPEMQRVDISWAILQMKALGIDNVLHFDFLSPPSTESMVHALELLFSLGALDGDGKLLTVGEQMAEMPVEPRLSKSLLSSYEFGCGEEMLSIAAMCAVEHPFISMRARASQEARKRLTDCISEFAAPEGDHLTLLNIYRQYAAAAAGGGGGAGSSWCDSMCLQVRVLMRAKEIRGHLSKMLKRFNPFSESEHSEQQETAAALLAGSIMPTTRQHHHNCHQQLAFASCGDDTVAVRRCLVAGYFANVAQLGHDGRYKTVRGHNTVTPHPTSIFARYGAPPEWVIYNDVVHTTITQIRELTKIEPLWLLEQAQHYYDTDKKLIGKNRKY